MNYTHNKPTNANAARWRIGQARNVPRAIWSPVTEVKGALGLVIRRLRWCEDLSVFRDVRTAHEINKRLPEGYYVDATCDGEVTSGIVCRITGRDGKSRFLAGYSDPWNDGAGCIDVGNVYTSERECLHAADQLAEIHGEECREDSAQQMAEQDIEQARDYICEIRRQHSAICKNIGACVRELPQLLRDTLHKQLAELRAELKQQGRIIKLRQENYWTAVH